MDNFEHLLAGTPLLGELLQATPQVSLLATSREKLNLSSETVFHLSGLGVAEWQTPAELLAHSAGELFVHSAQRADPAFELHPEDVRPIARICRLVEGMPLGIVLAAAWVDQLSPQEIAAEVALSLDFLETEMRDVPARQRSVRAVFETSWERLSAAGRELFKKLSIFRGGFTRPAAGEVAGASMRQLAGLVNKSFLRRDRESGRYEVHELLRQFAAEWLKSEPEIEMTARQAHAGYFAEFTQNLLEPLRSPRQRATLDEIEADIENIRVAWRQLAEQGRAAEMSRMIETLWYFHEIRSWYHAGLDLFGSGEIALQTSAGDEGGEVVTAQIRAAMGFYTILLGSPERGLEMSEQSVATLRRLGRRKENLLPLAVVQVGNFVLNRMEEAKQAIQERQEIATDLGHEWWEENSRAALANAYMWTGSYREARRHAEESASRWEQIGDPWATFWPNTLLAGLAALEGNYAEARERYVFVLETVQSINYQRGLQSTYTHLGNVSLQLQETQEAAGYYLESLAIGDELGQTREMLGTLYDIARVWRPQIGAAMRSGYWPLSWNTRTAPSMPCSGRPPSSRKPRRSALSSKDVCRPKPMPLPGRGGPGVSCRASWMKC